MAAGGGDEIGASCYYLQIGDTKLLLDFGLRSEGHRMPDYKELLRNAMVESIYDINTIIISHAHIDHYAGLRYLEGTPDNFRIIATPKTKSKLQEYVAHEEFELDNELLKVTNCINSIIPYEYYQSFYSRSVRITFLPAGHMKGAAMTLIEYGEYKILYTGDFSFPLTSFDKEKCDQEVLQIVKQCNVLIMESTHGEKDAFNLNARRHADYNQLMWFTKLVSPRYLFLVHQNIESKAVTLMNEIREDMPDMNVVRVENKKVYEVEMREWTGEQY